MTFGLSVRDEWNKFSDLRTAFLAGGGVLSTVAREYPWTTPWVWSGRMRMVRATTGRRNEDTKGDWMDDRVRKSDKRAASKKREVAVMSKQAPEE